jgi:hypothetical protein
MAPVRFATPDLILPEVAEKICNGIGPARGKTWASRLFWSLAWAPLFVAWALGLQAAFREAGRVHDLLYFMGGTNRDKLLADGIFVGLLLDSVGHWGVVWRPAGWVLALTYFCLVASCGWGSFSKRERPLEIDEVPSAAEEEL